MIAATKNSEKTPDIIVHYILMFLLCHVARYKAPLWKEIMGGTKQGENIALIEKFIAVSETKFPKLVLDELSGKYFIFEKG